MSFHKTKYGRSSITEIATIVPSGLQFAVRLLYPFPFLWKVSHMFTCDQLLCRDLPYTFTPYVVGVYTSCTIIMIQLGYTISC